MPTIKEWLVTNNYYEQAEMIDINGNEISAWYGRDDPKYNANVFRVEPKSATEPWICAKIYTDWKGE